MTSPVPESANLARLIMPALRSDALSGFAHEAGRIADTLELGVGGPVDGGEVVGEQLGLAVLEEVEREAGDGEVVVGGECGERVGLGADLPEAVRQHMLESSVELARQ